MFCCIFIVYNCNPMAFADSGALSPNWPFDSINNPDQASFSLESSGFPTTVKWIAFDIDPFPPDCTLLVPITL